jgi:phenylpyruvate tautomerase PptA (4-oxalocrotonate tautomerase family)
MPVYQVAHAGIPFTLMQRDRIARGITRIHHDVTHAPEPFVRVVFEPMPYGNIYTAGEIDTSIVLFGNVRAGRSEVQRRQLVEQCYALLREVTGADPGQIVVGLNELPSTWLMEAGFFMPEATDEAESAWIARLQDAYPGRYDEWGGEGKHPEVASDDEATRLERLRHLTERYLTVARGQGHDVRSLLGQLTELVGDDGPSVPAGRR